MELWSHAYLADGTADWATAALEVYAWRRITSEHGETGRLFAEICAGEATLWIALGTPVQPPAGAEALFTSGMTQGAADRLYLPAWALQALGLHGCGEFVPVDWYPQNTFPAATRICLRPHDSAFYHADAKEELEVALTRLGVVARGTTVSIPLEKLGGYEVAFDVVGAEPADIVLAEGDEVAIEFEEALDAEAYRVAAVVPAAAPAATEEEPMPAEEPMIPTGPMWNPVGMPATSIPTGRALSTGTSVRLLPDGTRWNPWKHGPWTGPP